ncbi:MAG TPA: hypothetical protein VF659_04980 [Pyrinomonadaceae bacterium]|jgi:hypothetical protein
MRLAPGHEGLSGRAACARRRASRVLWLLSLVCLLPATRNAQPRPALAPTPAQRTATLADYRERVGTAAAMLEGLALTYQRAKDSEKPEVWSREDFDSDFIVELPSTEKTTFVGVRGLLPRKERVGLGAGPAVEVDNTWLHTELGESKRPLAYGERALVLRALAARLRSLEERLGEAEKPAADETDRDAERGRLNAILRGREFDREARQEQGNALQRLVERFLNWLKSLLPDGPAFTPGASPTASLATQVIVYGLCLAVLAYVARRLWLRRRPGGGSRGPKRKARVVLGERLEADQTASDLLDDAERLARAGDLRGAIRKAYVALLCELGDRGVVRLAQHKTNRDYLNAVRRAAAPGLYTQMLPLTFDFEVHWYGLRAASDADWESFRARCRKALKEAVGRQ